MGQPGRRAKALGCELDAAEPADRGRPSGKVALPSPTESVSGGGIPILALGIAPYLQQACKDTAASNPDPTAQGEKGKIPVCQPPGMVFPEKV